MAEPVRLQRYLSAAGVAARRKAEELITAGRVTVNGEVVTVLGTKIDPDQDAVTVDGEAVAALDQFYVLFNKPKGCITAVTDDRGRPTVMDYLPNLPVPVKPVGRLDFYSEGVLLLTNDGELASRLLAPANHVAKTYHVKVHGQLERSHIAALRDGITLDDGNTTLPAEIEVLPGESKHTWLAITIHEGKHRQIHRMIEALGYRVDKLQRVAFATLTFHDLRVGDARELTQHELNALRDLVGLDHSAVARGRWRTTREETDIARRARAKARAEHEAAALSALDSHDEAYGDPEQMDLDGDDRGATTARGSRRGPPSADREVDVRRGPPSADREVGTRRGPPVADRGAGARRGPPMADRGAGARRGPPSADRGAGARRGPPMADRGAGARRGPAMADREVGARRGPPMADRGAGARRGPPMADREVGARRGPPSADRGAGARRGPPMADRGAGARRGPPMADRGAGARRGPAMADRGAGARRGPPMADRGAGARRGPPMADRGAGARRGPPMADRGAGARRGPPMADRGAGARRGPPMADRGAGARRGPPMADRGAGARGYGDRPGRSWVGGEAAGRDRGPRGARPAGGGSERRPGGGPRTEQKRRGFGPRVPSRGRRS